MSGDVHVRFCERLGVKLPRATHLVILVNGQWRDGWLLRAVDRRLREELAKLDLRVNEAKSRVVDLTQGEAFGFLGFTFLRLRSPRGRWWVRGGCGSSGEATCSTLPWRAVGDGAKPFRSGPE